MNFPDYTTLELNPTPADDTPAVAGPTVTDWEAAVHATAPAPAALADWQTIEQIPVKPVYGPADLRGVEHLGYTAGIAPYPARPVQPTMYVQQPWTIRQYAGFSTAEESNAFYRRNLAGRAEGPLRRLRPRDPPRL
jgi:methylmalonyl-CoA mutase